MKWITQISRVLVGVLFIISGLIKANDTLGFSYKLIEYFEIFNLTAFNSYAVFLSMVICIFEIISGVALLLGIYTKLNAYLLLILIVFFTLLTGYSAITHKVTDCGCFGDALKLTPFTSFMKDVVLLALILFIFIGQKHIKGLFNPVIMNIALFTSLLVATFFTMYTYMFMPVKDFLPYKIGNNIQELSTIPPGAKKDVVEMIFIYSKGGKNFEFTANSLPEDLDSYQFIDRKDKVIEEGYKPPVHDFKLYDSAGIEFTDSLFSSNQYKLILVQTKVEESRKASGVQIEKLAKDWLGLGGEIWALTASNATDIKGYIEMNLLPFTYYSMDAIPLKSMVRSNPGLILMKKNVVVKKWSAYNLPEIKTIQKYMK